MNKYRVALTEEEEALFAKIDLSPSHSNHAEAHEAYKANQQPILDLLASLGERGGIPEHRIRYWTDPDYKPGGIKASRKGVFERHGRDDEDIYTHPNFIPHLRYLLLGSELPSRISDAFEREVGDPQWINSTDALSLGKFARKLVRENGRTGRQVAEEFFKLSLDIGLSLDAALIVMRSVQQVR